MAYIKVIKEFNEAEILSAVISIFKKSEIYTELIKTETITSYGITEATADKDFTLIVYTKKNCCDECNCNIECKHEYPIKKTLNLEVESLYNAYSYVFYPKNSLKRDDAIRVIKPPSEDDPGFKYSYNACVLEPSPKQISFVLPTEHSPYIRILKAIEAYKYDITIYKYTEPDEKDFYDFLEYWKETVVEAKWNPWRSAPL